MRVGFVTNATFADPASRVISASLLLEYSLNTDGSAMTSTSKPRSKWKRRFGWLLIGVAFALLAIAWYIRTHICTLQSLRKIAGMSRMTRPSTSALFFLVAITVVGCGGGTPTVRSMGEASGDQKPQVVTAVDDADGAPVYVTCRAMLTDFQGNYQWFDDSSFGHDDGVAPLASFVLVSPPGKAGRAMGILFKYPPDATTGLTPVEEDIGRQFTVQIPEEFLTGKSQIIDNASVRNFRRVDP